MGLSTKKMNLSYFTIFIILLMGVGSKAINTTTEDVNPFSKLLSSEGDINYSTGTVSFPSNLYTMPGRNGLDYKLRLVYSSNVFTRVKARNDISPTSWVGLGWSLTVGSITCDHKNTANLEDDEYFYASSEGYSSRILTKNVGGTIEYYIEQQPYILIKCIKKAGDPNVITGWILTDTEGMKYYYGDLDFNMSKYPNRRNATRYTLRVNNSLDCWYNNGSSDIITPTDYPYQWDIHVKEDRFGNRILFEYNQFCENITLAVNNKSFPYTRASYLKRVTSPEGAYIEFSLSDKVVGKNIDPYLFYDDKKGAIVKYEKKKLDNITVYNASKDKIKTFDFVYDYLNRKALGDDYAKLVLKKIIQKDYKNPAGKVINVDEYFYYDEADQAGNKGYNYGALKRRTNYLGMDLTYLYDEIELPTTNASASVPIAVSLQSATSIKSGYKTGGNPFYVATSSDQIVIFNWTGHSWEIERIDPGR